MLTELRIRQLGVIAESTVEFGPGMTAVTGETGAGKTMVVSSLGLLLGQRADSSVVRHGAAKAIVEGRFCGLGTVAGRAEEAGAEVDGDELLVARHITSSGRSRAFIGGAQSSVTALAELANELATIHGQSEQIRLGSPERQREVLDRYCGPDHLGLLTAHEAEVSERRRLVVERRELLSRSQQRAREKDMLAFALDEISAVDPQPGEDVQLLAEAQRLQAMDDLRQLAESANDALSGSPDGLRDDAGAVGLVGMARKAMDRAGEQDSVAETVAGQLREAAFLLNDAAATVAGYLADLEADPLRLEEITTRRAALAGLTRKYGASIDEVLEWAAQAAAKVVTLDDSDGRIEQLGVQIEQLDESLARSAKLITRTREQAARQLAEAARGELAALAMPHARLEFQLRPLEEIGPHGAESVHLVFSANPGSDLAPLSRVASGGELSRVRLALEAVLADSDNSQTDAQLLHSFVFDEVDAGVGGTVAVEIGRRLAALAKHSQVIVVTHLAQVAAFADRQYVVAKSSTGEVTTSDLRQVQGQDRLEELARMMGGISSSSSSLAHARELLEAAGQA